MQKKGRLVSLFYFNENIAGKDMFLVPKYLAEELEMECEFIFPVWDENSHFKEEYRGVKLTPIKSKSRFNSTFWSEKEMGWWLIKNARQIDVLSLFWLNSRNMIFAKIYKMLNPKGVCYIKGDTSGTSMPINRLKKGIWKSLITSIDVFSVETECIYSKIRNQAMGEYLSQKVILMSNGFDIENYEKFQIVRKSFSEKENIILTVGRIGSKEKNNEMMLAAIDGLVMKDWKLLFVGPVEDDFKEKYNDFITRNPEKCNKAILVGGIYDRKDLWEIYNKSKVFLLTSPKECMAQVYSEALAFGNYIITTAVQGSVEITDNQRLGKIVGLNDVAALRLAIEDVIDCKTDISPITEEAIKLSNEKFNWRSLTSVVAQRIKAIYNAKHS